MPASLGAPCADETDSHAAHDAHEVLACQAARDADQSTRSSHPGRGRSQADLIPLAEQPKTREAGDQQLVGLRDSAPQSPDRVLSEVDRMAYWNDRDVTLKSNDPAAVPELAWNSILPVLGAAVSAVPVLSQHFVLKAVQARVWVAVVILAQ